MSAKQAPATSLQLKSLFLPLDANEVVIYCSFFSSKRQLSTASPTVSVAIPTTTAKQWEASHILVVLESGAILLYSLESSDAGPVVVHRINVPSKEKGSRSSDAASVSEFSMTSKPGTPNGSVAGMPSGGDNKATSGSGRVATCASLVPRHLVPFLSSEFLHHHPTLVSGGQSASAVHLSSTVLRGAANSEGTFSMRGIVGFKSGRVEIFSNSSYVFGFLAHPSCSVVQASIAYAADIGGGVTGAASRSTNNLNDKVSINSSGKKYLDDECRVVFVTMGEDGHIFVWRRRNAQDGYEGAALAQPGAFSKCYCFGVMQPCFDVFSAAVQSCVTHPGGTERPTSNSAPAAAPSSGGTMPPLVSSMIVFPGNGHDKELHVVSADNLEPVASTVLLPGTFSRTSAVAVEGSLCLVAREKVVYSVSYTTRVVQRLLTTNSTVVKLELSRPLAVLGCNNGKVIVFGSDSGQVLCNHYTYSASPVTGLSFHYGAMLLCVLDQTGAVEVLQLPAEFLRHGSVDSTTLISSANILRKMIQLEESSNGDGALVTARRAVGEESLLLSRMSMPRSVTPYLGAQHKIL